MASEVASSADENREMRWIRDDKRKGVAYIEGLSPTLITI
jgi:hypothetical protein